MAPNRSTTAQVRNKNGDQLSLQQHESDSPIIPVPQLEKLHDFRPDLVDWVIDQTGKEADHRRSETKRVNTLVFIQQSIGQVFALFIGLAGIGVGGYVALNGESSAGAAIASVAITGLAVVFLTGRVGRKTK